MLDEDGWMDEPDGDGLFEIKYPDGPIITRKIKDGFFEAVGNDRHRRQQGRVFRRVSTKPSDPETAGPGHSSGSMCKIHGGTKMLETKSPESKAPKALDIQVGGNHYKQMAIQPAVFAHENNLRYLEGSVIKRICSYHFTGDLEELDKAIHELQMIRQMNHEGE